MRKDGVACAGRGMQGRGREKSRINTGDEKVGQRFAGQRSRVR
jgi:hypothetical protein